MPRQRAAVLAASMVLVYAVLTAQTSAFALPIAPHTTSQVARMILPVSGPYGTAISRTMAISSGVILRDYDPPPKKWLAGHRGIDFAATPGTDIYATKTGSVSFAGNVGGEPVVVLRHADGTRTTYEPAVAYLPIGAQVTRGSVIATTSISEASHCASSCLHVGVKAGESYLDPWEQFGGRIHVILKSN